MTPHAIRRRKQTVGLLSFLFPSFFPSAFDLEALLPLEAVCARLEKLPRVRISREVGQKYESLLPFHQSAIETPTISVAPFDLRLASRDDDTYLYRVELDDPRYKVSVVGYLKRWEEMSTVVTGRVHFDLHYAGVLAKSVLYTGVIAVVTLVLTYVLLLLSGLELHYLFTNNPAILAALWLVVLAGLWLNDVVVPAHKGRERLLTRLEDMVLLPQV